MKRAGGEMQTINKIHSMTSEVKIVFLYKKTHCSAQKKCVNMQVMTRKTETWVRKGRSRRGDTKYYICGGSCWFRDGAVLSISTVYSRLSGLMEGEGMHR
jgi:hypothetical protein